MTDEQVTANVADVAPEGTVTVAATWAAANPLVRLTVIPLDPAGLLSVMVPVDELWPATVVGFSVNAVRLGGFTFNDPDVVVPLELPTTEAVV